MNGSVRKPSFLGSGAAKAGTSSLLHSLKQCPGIVIPDDDKEPAYFCRGGGDSRASARRPWQDYYFARAKAAVAALYQGDFRAFGYAE